MAVSGFSLWTPGLNLAQDHCGLLPAQSLGPLADPGEDFPSVLQWSKERVEMGGLRAGREKGPMCLI